MNVECYNLKLKGEISKAILIAWIDSDVGVFQLYNDLGKFKNGETIQINMKTLEVTKYIDLFEVTG